MFTDIICILNGSDFPKIFLTLREAEGLVCKDLDVCPIDVGTLYGLAGGIGPVHLAAATVQVYACRQLQCKAALKIQCHEKKYITILEKDSFFFKN
jgi:hypothetical protein